MNMFLIPEIFMQQSCSVLTSTSLLESFALTTIETSQMDELSKIKWKRVYKLQSDNTQRLW